MSKWTKFRDKALDIFVPFHDYLPGQDKDPFLAVLRTSASDGASLNMHLSLMVRTA